MLIVVTSSYGNFQMHNDYSWLLSSLHLPELLPYSLFVHNSTTTAVYKRQLAFTLSFTIPKCYVNSITAIIDHSIFSTCILILSKHTAVQ